MSYEQQEQHLEGASHLMPNVVDTKNNSDSPSDENDYQTAYDQYWTEAECTWADLSADYCMEGQNS